MKSLLWVGDACVASGFARATHNTLAHLHEWKLHVLGINYKGDPHGYPYPIYPCGSYGDAFGVRRIGRLVTDIKPDCIVLQNDPWNIPRYLEALSNAKITDIPIVGSIAVDGLNCNGAALNGLTVALFWTEFGKDQAIRGGYTGVHGVVPLGVDLEIYRPMLRHLIRKQLEIHPGAEIDVIQPDSFVVLNVNRNQLRKRLDLTVQYFCEWVHSRKISDAFLVVHACPTGEEDFDLPNLMQFYGLRNRLVMIQPDIGNGVPEAFLAATYNIADLQISTSMGEGLGLTTLEGMACGIPQMVPDFAASGEICEEAALKIGCTSFHANRAGINTIGGVVDRGAFIEGLDFLYKNPEVRAEFTRRGRTLVEQPKFRWENIGACMAQWLDNSLGRAAAPVEEVSSGV